MFFVLDGPAYYRHRKFIAMAMHVSAFAIVSIEGMACFKGKNLGNADLLHGVDSGTKILFCAEKNFVLMMWESCVIFASFFLNSPMATELFEQLEFEENPLFETIIADLLQKQYSVVDNFFSAEEVERLRMSLMAKYEADRFKKSAIGNRLNAEIDKAVRGDFILWIDENLANPAESLFFEKINRLVRYLNKTCFLGILHKEFHYAVYPQGTFYKRHLDTFQNDDRRKLSIVCYLNEDYWPRENGGELTIYAAEEVLDILPLPGRMVVFESQVLEHEVKVVKASERLSITGWLKTR